MTTRPNKDTDRLNAGVQNLAEGRYEIAREDFIQVLDSSRASGDRLSGVIALYNLGVLSMETGTPDDAQGWFVQALAAAREVDFTLVSSLALRALAQDKE